MKRILISTVAAVVLASAANAAFHVRVDVDTTAYNVGDLVTIDLTLTTDGDHSVGAFGTLEYQAAWDPAVLEVANAPSGVSPNGHSAQTVFPQLSGSTEPACLSPGNGQGGHDGCVTLSQVNSGFSSVTINGIAYAQLILRTLGGDGGGAAGLAQLSDHLTIGIETGSEAADSITIGPNYQTATHPVAPEPTTAALIGLGLIGLGVARPPGRHCTRARSAPRSVRPVH